MPKIKTHSGAKSVSKQQKAARLSVLMLIPHTFLQRNQQSVREIFVKLQLAM